MAELWAHQKKGLAVLGQKPSAALLMWPRTGKTRIIVADAERLMKADKITALVVIAPLGVHRVWEKEWQDASTMKDVWVHAWCGGGTRELNRLSQKLISVDQCVFTINYDALLTDRGYRIVEQILKRQDAMLVLDEAHRIKTPGAKRSKLCVKLGRLARYRRILTGTPIANSPLDLFMPFRFLDPQILGHDNFFTFRARYAVLKRRVLASHAFDEVVGYQHLDELRAKIAPISYVISQEEAAKLLDLPPRQHVVLPVDLSPQQRRMYDELTNELTTRLDTGEEMSAPLAITQLMRLQQILSGWFVPDGGIADSETKTFSTPMGHFISEETNPREKVLLDYLDDVPGKVIIWCRFIPERERLREKLIKTEKDASAVSVVGDQRNGVDAISFFKDVPRCRYLIASPEGPASEGVDLSCADTVVYYSNSFRLTSRQQSEERPFKKGRKTPVTIVDLCAAGTVDEHIVQSLAEKRDMARTFSGKELRKWLH